MTIMDVITIMAQRRTAGSADARSKPAATRPASSTFTTVPVKPETLRRLRSYKVGGKTYDDVLNAFMDETPTEAFWKEMERRRQEPDLPWHDVKRKLGL